VKARITDAKGNLLTQAQPTGEFLRHQKAIAEAEARHGDGPAREGREFVAPIIVEGMRMGTIRMTANPNMGLDEQRLLQLGEKFGLDLKQVKSLLQQIDRTRNARPAAIQFLFTLANAIARLCWQEYQLSRRVADLTAVYSATMMLSESRDLGQLLNRTAKMVPEMMDAHASSIRLLNEENGELVIKAVHNLSPTYLSKGAVRLAEAEIDRIALSSKGYEYVADMTEDPRVLYRSHAAEEGIVSCLSVGMRYKGKQIGIVRVYTKERHVFSQQQIELLQAIAAQAAAAIENARLANDAAERAALDRQMKLAAEVQQRMIPSKSPDIRGVDLAAVYVPLQTLGGDFYDFIELPNSNLGLAMADVSGKGVAASLIMSAVRAALRAQVDNVYYLYDVVSRVNNMVCRDTKPQEFVTLFYGVLDVMNKRLTYCNAGHPPPVILRDGKIIELLSTNLVLGIDPNEPYQQHIFELKQGDFILAYTDGVTDTANPKGELFGRQRLMSAFAQGGKTASEVAQRVLWELRKFSGISPGVDDITLTVTRIL
jgi:sigma-B regulation protein RsbU (phosphoserine phosphatase)